MTASSTAQKTPRLVWPDLLRGLAMLAILYDHTEIYYTGGNVVPYNLYVANALTAFFFVSGFFFKPSDPSAGRASALRHKLRSIVLRLLLPYFLFTAALSLPKALYYGEPWQDYAWSILTGQASWFIAALIVASLCFALLLYACRGSHRVLAAVSLLSFGAAMALSGQFESLWWKADIALLALPLLYLGYAYRCCAASVDRLLSRRSLPFIFLLFIGIKVYVHAADVEMLICPLRIDNVWVFAVDTLVGIALLTCLTKLLEKQAHGLRLLSWTGSHSLVYYFLCGAVPLTLSLLLTRLGFGYDGSPWRVLAAFVLVYAVSTLAVWPIYRYLLRWMNS